MMNQSSTCSTRSCEGYSGEERRLTMRVRERFSARVQGANPQGGSFEVDTILENLSASGLYLRMAQRVREGDKLSIRIKLPPVTDVAAPGLDVATQGDVQRVDCLDNDTFGVAVRFTRHRVL